MKALQNFTGTWRRFITYDESTCVALLDIYVTHGLLSWFTIKKNSNLEQTLIGSADTCAEQIKSKYPLAMRSRPYLRWILLKSAVLGSKGLNGLTDPHSAMDNRCKNFPGLIIHLSSDFTSFYVPKNAENPGWYLPEAPAQANAPLHAVVKASEQLHDLVTQVLAHRLLIWRSGSPLPLLQNLCLWQKEKQGDERGRLETLVSSYLACDDRTSREWLLAQLKNTDDWTGESQLRDPVLYLARDSMQRELAHSLHGTQPGLRTEDRRYYQWLHSPSQRWNEEDQMRNNYRRQPSAVPEAMFAQHGQEVLPEEHHRDEEVPLRNERHQERVREVKLDIARQNERINSRPRKGYQSPPYGNRSSRTIYVSYHPDFLESSYSSDSSDSSYFSDASGPNLAVVGSRRARHGKHSRIVHSRGSAFETDNGCITLGRPRSRARSPSPIPSQNGMDAQSDQASMLGVGNPHQSAGEQAGSADVGLSERGQDAYRLAHHDEQEPAQALQVVSVQQNAQQYPDRISHPPHYAVAPSDAIPLTPAYNYYDSQGQEDHSDRSRYPRNSHPAETRRWRDLEHGVDRYTDHIRCRAEDEDHDRAADDLFYLEQEIEMLRRRECETRSRAEAMRQRAEMERERARNHSPEREREICERQRATCMMPCGTERDRQLEVEHRCRRYEADGPKWPGTRNQGRTNNFYFF